MRRSEATPDVLLIGSTGFIGAGIQAALLAAGSRVRILVRSSRPDVDHVHSLVPWFGDLADDSSIDAAFDGISTVIHAASYVGDDPELQRQVNVAGTRKLTEAVARNRVSKLIYVSTFGVYGGAYLPGVTEDDVVPHPRSSLSASRLDAESMILNQGGIVIRPALVYGIGDRWVIPPLVRLVLSLRAWIDEGSQLVSAIRHDRLGELIVALAANSPDSGVFHAAHQQPIGIRELAEPIMKRLGCNVLASRTAVSARDALERAGASQSAIQLLTTDSWISSAKIWAASGLVDGGPTPLYRKGDVEAYLAGMGDLRHLASTDGPAK